MSEMTPSLTAIVERWTVEGAPAGWVRLTWERPILARAQDRPRGSFLAILVPGRDGNGRPHRFCLLRRRTSPGLTCLDRSREYAARGAQCQKCQKPPRPGLTQTFWHFWHSGTPSPRKNRTGATNCV